MGSTDFDYASLSLATVGLFFICCATLQKKPRHILEEAFGIYRGGLRDLKSSVFKRNQVVLGFICVVLAILTNLFATVRTDRAGWLDGLSAPLRVACVVAVMAALCGVLNYLSRLWSKAAFKRLVQEVVTEYQWPFEENMILTREIGNLLGVPRRDDDTVESYTGRIRAFLGLPQTLPASAAQRVRRASRLG